MDEGTRDIVSLISIHEIKMSISERLGEKTGLLRDTTEEEKQLHETFNKLCEREKQILRKYE